MAVRCWTGTPGLPQTDSPDCLDLSWPPVTGYPGNDSLCCLCMDKSLIFGFFLRGTVHVWEGGGLLIEVDLVVTSLRLKILAVERIGECSLRWHFRISLDFVTRSGFEGCQDRVGTLISPRGECCSCQQRGEILIFSRG